MNRKFHNYQKEFGDSQKELVRFYNGMGKGLDEITQLLKPIPRASIRGRLSEIRNEF